MPLEFAFALAKMALANMLTSLTYEQALKKQTELAKTGRHGWFFFACPPTVTLGARSSLGDLLVDRKWLEAQGVQVCDVDRGGQATYHGPGQIVGFPYGSLHAHLGDGRAARRFVETLESKVSSWISAKLSKQADRKLATAPPESVAGIWVQDVDGQSRKICSIGLRFSRESIGHGFSLNLDARVQEGFRWIRPCGDSNQRTTSLFAGILNDSEVSEFARDLASELEGSNDE